MLTQTYVISGSSDSLSFPTTVLPERGREPHKEHSAPLKDPEVAARPCGKTLASCLPLRPHCVVCTNAARDRRFLASTRVSSLVRQRVSASAVTGWVLGHRACSVPVRGPTDPFWVNHKINRSLTQTARTNLTQRFRPSVTGTLQRNVQPGPLPGAVLFQAVLTDPGLCHRIATRKCRVRSPWTLVTSASPDQHTALSHMCVCWKTLCLGPFQQQNHQQTAQKLALNRPRTGHLFAE